MISCAFLTPAPGLPPGSVRAGGAAVGAGPAPQAGPRRDPGALVLREPSRFSSASARLLSR